MEDQPASTSTAEPPVGCGRGILRLWHKITIEPAVFLFTFAYGFYSIIAQNLLIDRVCTVNLNLTSEVCDHLDHYKHDQMEVQKQVTLIVLYTSILSSIPCMILTLLVGPWSDRNGRKPLMIAPIIGCILSQVVLVLIRAFPQARGEYYLATSIYSFVSGGFATFTTAMYSYIADISRVRGRTARIALLDFCLMLGFPLGVYTSSKVYLVLGYYGVFGITIGIHMINWLFVGLFVKETCGPRSSYQLLDNQSEETLDPVKLLDIRNILSVFTTCFQRRPNRRRRVILLLIFMMIVNTTVFNTGTMTYLYTRLKFDWNEQDYSLWNSVSALFTAVATVLALPVLSFGLGISDGIIGIMGCISGIASNVLIAFVTEDWMMYLCSGIGALSASSAIVIRAMLSKVGCKEDLGKIFSLVGCLESTVPILALPALTLVYNSTIDTLPGTVFLVQAGIFLTILIIISYIHCILMNPVMRYGQIITNSGEEGNDNPDPISQPTETRRQTNENSNQSH